ncbi:hypothetical protein WDZ92_53490 [Nostoc sp. NIES-2111]
MTRSYNGLLTLTQNVARARCSGAFDPHVILAVFQHLRLSAPARRMYDLAVGSELDGAGLPDGRHIVNPLIARTVAVALNARSTGEEVTVQGELIASYSVLAAA